MPRFYRIESEDGKGVYHSEEANEVFFKVMSFATAGTDRHPLPSMDSKLVENAHKRGTDASEMKWSGDWRFGFDSIAQLRSWFYDEDLTTALGNAGLLLTIYEVDDIISGNAQAVINAENHVEENIVDQYNLAIAVQKNFEFPA